MNRINTCMITLHSINNPGSVLQAYALNYYLNYYLDVNNTIIDYRPYYSKIGTQVLKGLIRTVLFYPNERALNKQYNSFVKENMSLTKRRYYCYRQLASNPPQASCYIVGGDQLWNPDYKCGNDKAFTLDFIKSDNKVSFSTSVGKSDLSSKELYDLTKRIEDFKWLSVREESTSCLLSDSLKTDVHWVCDPVFLLKKEDYSRFTYPNTYGKYAVMYLAQSSPLLDDYIEYLKKETNLKIIQAGGNIKRCNCDIHLKGISPVDFLSLIKNAEFVISGSFHATAFSLIFKKDFSVFLPSNNGERLKSLLHLAGLESRIIEADNDFPIASNELDYSFIDSKLDAFIENSKNQLQNCIMEIVNE